MDEELFTTSAAARFCAQLGEARSEVWFRYASTTGRIPALKTTTGRRLFRRSDLEEFVRKAKESQPPEAA